MSDLKVGDTIHCLDTAHAVEMVTELAKEGIVTDFLYEKDGIEGLWLEVTAVEV